MSKAFWIALIVVGVALIVIGERIRRGRKP